MALKEPPARELPQILHRPARPLPPLENGDRLTRAEFERRYAAMPQVKKAELIENEFQPDAMLRLEPAAGGRSRITTDDYVEGAPELIVEVAASSVSIDLHTKKAVYRRNSVQEYLVLQTEDQRVDWFELREGEYTPLSPQESEPGILRSRVFPGLWLNVTALLAGDLAGVLATLQRGPQSVEHAEFVRRLEGT